MPGIRHNTLYGAIAYLKQDANAADMALNKGLLVIRATGDSASIIKCIYQTIIPGDSPAPKTQQFMLELLGLSNTLGRIQTASHTHSHTIMMK